MSKNPATLLLRDGPYREFDSIPIRGAIHNVEALDLLRYIETGSASLVFLDPPFNIGKEYVLGEPSGDRRPTREYSEWLKAVCGEAIRIVKPGGAVYLYHLPEWAMRVAPQFDTELDFRHWIAVSMKYGFARGNRLYPAHYALLYFTKGKPQHFNRPRLSPQTCRHCGKYIKDYGGYRHIIEKQGINLSDVWDDLSPVRHQKYKSRIQNELPWQLTDRVLAISGEPDGLYVDPFAGGGSGVISAVKHGMTFAAGDLVTENCAVIASRLTTLFNDETAEDSNGRDCECAAD